MSPGESEQFPSSQPSIPLCFVLHILLCALVSTPFFFLHNSVSHTFALGQNNESGVSDTATPLDFVPASSLIFKLGIFISRDYLSGSILQQCLYGILNTTMCPPGFCACGKCLEWRRLTTRRQLRRSCLWTRAPVTLESTRNHWGH